MTVHIVISKMNNSIFRPIKFKSSLNLTFYIYGYLGIKMIYISKSVKLIGDSDMWEMHQDKTLISFYLTYNESLDCCSIRGFWKYRLNFSKCRKPLHIYSAFTKEFIKYI